MDDDYGDEPDERFEDNEPIGSCEECDEDLYEDENYDGLCSRCAWIAAGCPEPGDGDPDDPVEREP